MAHFKHHVFFCLNQRENGEQCCSDFNADTIYTYMKKKIKGLDLNGPGKIRVNRGGCFDRCHEGPLLVIYPSILKPPIALLLNLNFLGFFPSENKIDFEKSFQDSFRLLLC